MPRDFIIFGESLVQVQGPQGSAISPLSQLGLAADAIQVTIHQLSEACIVDAYGKGNPVDEQVFGGWAEIEMNLVHFNTLILDECFRLSFPTAGTTGTLGRAGWRRGNGQNLFAPTNSLINLNIASPVAGLPFNFPYSFMSQQPYVWPVGTTRSIVKCRWKAIPYSIDPYNNGTGSQNVPLYTRTVAPIGANP